ncbi:MAG: hypothetical protein NPIRA02_40120 [Nitrospirales bacterium]|nr:MAG: hypothetical protein NPIRA02_40120 [Nitrospirales bacterium]
MTRLEKEILALPPEEQEHLTLTTWESLETHSESTDTLQDQEGITLALQRDIELESSSIQPRTHSEFLRHTNTDAAEHRVSSAHDFRPEPRENTL